LNLFKQKIYYTAGTNYESIDAMAIQWKDAASEVVTGNCNMYQIPVEFTIYIKGFAKKYLY